MFWFPKYRVILLVLVFGKFPKYQKWDHWFLTRYARKIYDHESECCPFAITKNKLYIYIFCRREDITGMRYLILWRVHIDTVKVVIKVLRVTLDGNNICRSTRVSGLFGASHVRRDFQPSVIMKHTWQNTRDERFHATCATKDLKVNEAYRCIMPYMTLIKI